MKTDNQNELDLNCLSLNPAQLCQTLATVLPYGKLNCHYDGGLAKSLILPRSSVVHDNFDQIAKCADYIISTSRKMDDYLIACIVAFFRMGYQRKNMRQSLQHSDKAQGGLDATKISKLLGASELLNEFGIFAQITNLDILYQISTLPRVLKEKAATNGWLGDLNLLNCNRDQLRNAVGFYRGLLTQAASNDNNLGTKKILKLKTSIKKLMPGESAPPAFKAIRELLDSAVFQLDEMLKLPSVGAGNANNFAAKSEGVSADEKIMLALGIESEEIATSGCKVKTSPRADFRSAKIAKFESEAGHSKVEDDLSVKTAAKIAEHRIDPSTTGTTCDEGGVSNVAIQQSFSFDDQDDHGERLDVASGPNQDETISNHESAVLTQSTDSAEAVESQRITGPTETFEDIEQPENTEILKPDPTECIDLTESAGITSNSDNELIEPSAVGTSEDSSESDKYTSTSAEIKETAEIHAAEDSATRDDEKPNVDHFDEEQTDDQPQVEEADSASLEVESDERDFVVDADCDRALDRHNKNFARKGKKKSSKVPEGSDEFTACSFPIINSDDVKPKRTEFNKFISAGVKFEAKGGRLHCSGPTTVLTFYMKQRIERLSFFFAEWATSDSEIGIRPRPECGAVEGEARYDHNT